MKQATNPFGRRLNLAPPLRARSAQRSDGRSWRPSRAASVTLGLLGLAAMAFLISPFDATLRGDIGAGVLERTLSAVPTGLSVAAATMVIDGVTAVLVALGLWANPRLSTWLERMLGPLLAPKASGGEDHEQGRVSVGRREPENRLRALSTTVLADLGVSMGIGAAAVLLRYPTAPVGKWLRLASLYTIVNSVFFGLVGWTVAGGANFLADAGFGWVRQGIIDWVPEPLVWTAIFVITVAVPWIRTSLEARKARPAATAGPAAADLAASTIVGEPTARSVSVSPVAAGAPLCSVGASPSEAVWSGVSPVVASPSEAVGPGVAPAGKVVGRAAMPAVSDKSNHAAVRRVLVSLAVLMVAIRFCHWLWRSLVHNDR